MSTNVLKISTRAGSSQSGSASGGVHVKTSGAQEVRAIQKGQVEKMGDRRK
jgi:hypothetical protein